MQTARTPFSVAFIAALAALGGCTTDEPVPEFNEPLPDFAAIEAQLLAPSGAMTQSNGRALMDALVAGYEAHTAGGGLSVSPGSSDIAPSFEVGAVAKSRCPALYEGSEAGSCDCDGGGRLEFDARSWRGFEGGAADGTREHIRLRLDNCSGGPSDVSMRKTERESGTVDTSITWSSGQVVSEVSVKHLDVVQEGVSKRFDTTSGYSKGADGVLLATPDGQTLLGRVSQPSDDPKRIVYELRGGGGMRYWCWLDSSAVDQWKCEERSSDNTLVSVLKF